MAKDIKLNRNKLEPKKWYLKPARYHNEDWNRMVWATFKPFVLLFSSLTIILLIINTIYYPYHWKHKTEVKSKYNKTITEILPKMFHKQSVYPLIHHFSIVGSLCMTAIIGNYYNEYVFTHFSGYALSAVWIHEHYHNYRLIMNSEAMVYNLAHVTHLLAGMTAFGFSATIIGNKHKRMEEKSVTRHNKVGPMPTVDTGDQT